MKNSWVYTRRIPEIIGLQERSDLVAIEQDPTKRKTQTLSVEFRSRICNIVTGNFVHKLQKIRI